MVDLLWLGFLCLPLGYIIFYVWALIFRVIPWLNIALTEILNLKLIQIVALIVFFTGGLGLFIICLILIFAMVIYD